MYKNRNRSKNNQPHNITQQRWVRWPTKSLSLSWAWLVSVVEPLIWCLFLLVRFLSPALSFGHWASITERSRSVEVPKGDDKRKWTESPTVNRISKGNPLFFLAQVFRRVTCVLLSIQSQIETYAESFLNRNQLWVEFPNQIRYSKKQSTLTTNNHQLTTERSVWQRSNDL